ncbi:MAG: ABC transporter permease [Bryobacteraceae bacterium]|nr:ABC transporter permease [Bryobacteraceae bacterium]
MPGKHVLGYQLGLAAFLLALWEAGARATWIDPFFFSRPSLIGARLAEWFSTSLIWGHLGATLLEALLAFVLGSAAGIVTGFWLGRWPLGAAVAEPFLQTANALPRVVLAPLFIFWFGLGIASKVAFGMTLVFFLVFFNTYRGVRSVERALIDNARLLGANERQLLRHVLLPSALGWIFSSLEASIGLAMVGAVVGEYLGATGGLGYLIAQAEGLLDTTGMLAGMALLAVVVLLIAALVRRAERRLLRWQQPR